MMFFAVYESRSGEEHVRQIAPNEKLDVRAMVKRWAEREFDFAAEPAFSEPGRHIPNGCADYQAEIRYTKAASSTCWDSEPFYMETGEA